MPGVRDSDSSLVVSDLKQPRSRSHKTLPPRRREIVIQIFAPDARDYRSDRHDAAKAPTLSLTHRGSTYDISGSNSERQDHKLSDLGYRVPEIRVSRAPPLEETSVREFRGTNRYRKTAHSLRTETAPESVSSDSGPDTAPRSSSSLRRQQRRNAYSQKPLERGKHPLKTEAKWDLDQSENSGISPRSSYCELTTPNRERSRNYDGHGIQDTELLGSLAMNDTGARDLAHESNVHGQVKDPHGPAHSLSLEQFRKDIGWPVDDPEDPDHQRFSGVSTASTVGAVIVDPVRPMKRGLRHTEKQSSLRSASSPVTKSERASMSSVSDTQHRLVHKAARITDEDRKNIAPEISMAVASKSEAPRQNVDVVPVVVIPERRSSLRTSPSTSTSRNPSKASSQRSRRRATTAPSRRASSLGPPQKGRQTTPDSVRGGCPPVVPSRRSSLSAPTSANNSRATSLTSESLRSHTLAMEDAERRKRQTEQSLLEPPPQTSRPNSHDMSDAPKTQSILIGIEDMSDLHSPSMPFSLGSMPSSPGQWELSEAKAVNFFPHKNESLLLVDQQMRGEKKASQDRSVDTQRSAMSRNPQQGVSIPVCQVSSPTPPKELEQDSSKCKYWEPAIRKFGPLRRAWTVRSRPATTDTLKRSLSTSATNRKARKQSNSRLHPFWRSNNTPEFTAKPSSPSQTNNGNEHIVKNSLGMPQPRAVINGPDLHTRRQARSGTRKRNRLYDPAINRSTLALGNTLNSPGFLDRTTRASPLRRHSFHFVSLVGYRVRLATMQKCLRLRLQLREERKHEARQEKLKQSIGDVVQVQSSAVNAVLPRGL